VLRKGSSNLKDIDEFHTTSLTELKKSFGD
jgi:hypothetical protein